MAKRLTRRDFFKSAAAETVAASVTPAWVPSLYGAKIATRDAEAPGVSDLQLDLEREIEQHKVVGASAAVYYKGSMETAAAGVLNVPHRGGGDP